MPGQAASGGQSCPGSRGQQVLLGPAAGNPACHAVGEGKGDDGAHQGAPAGKGRQGGRAWQGSRLLRKDLEAAAFICPAPARGSFVAAEFGQEARQVSAGRPRITCHGGHHLCRRPGAGGRGAVEQGAAQPRINREARQGPAGTGSVAVAGHGTKFVQDFHGIIHGLLRRGVRQGEALPAR